jgi:hypothetical protein
MRIGIEVPRALAAMVRLRPENCGRQGSRGLASDASQDALKKTEEFK